MDNDEFALSKLSTKNIAKKNIRCPGKISELNIKAVLDSGSFSIKKNYLIFKTFVSS